MTSFNEILTFIDTLNEKKIIDENNDKINECVITCSDEIFSHFSIKDIYSPFNKFDNEALVINYNGLPYLFEQRDVLQSEIDSQYLTEKIELIIKKNKIVESIFGDSDHNKKIFFKKKNYLNWIKKFSLSNATNTFKKENNYIIILNAKNLCLSNNHISILGVDCLKNIKKYESIDLTHINNQIDNHNKICKNDVCSNSSPSIFYFENINEQEYDLVKKFDNIYINLTLSHFSNTTSKDTNNQERTMYKIFGHKNVTIDYGEFIFQDIEERNSKIKQLKTLYDWIYPENYNPDKLRILQYVISIQLESESSTEEFVNSIDHIQSSTENSYNEHIEKRVKFFFEDKNKIQLEIYQRIRDFNKEFDKLSALMKNNLISILGVFPPIFLSIILKQSPPILFLRVFIFIFTLSLFIYTIYTISSINTNVKYIVNLYIQFKEHISQYLTPKVVTELFDINEEKDLFDKRLDDYKNTRLINLIIMIVIIIALLWILCKIELIINITK